MSISIFDVLEADPEPEQPPPAHNTIPQPGFEAAIMHLEHYPHNHYELLQDCIAEPPDKWEWLLNYLEERYR